MTRPTTTYYLPDGRAVEIDADVARGAASVSYQLADGTSTKATLQPPWVNPPLITEVIAWILDSPIPWVACNNAIGWAWQQTIKPQSTDPLEAARESVHWRRLHSYIFALDCILTALGKRENAKHVAEHDAREAHQAIGDVYMLTGRGHVEAIKAQALWNERQHRRELERLRAMEMAVLTALGSWPGTWTPEHAERLQRLAGQDDAAG